MMKKATIVILALVGLLISSAAMAADGKALFDAKCKACHGPDGKKLAKADLTSQTIQAKADDELIKFVGTNPKHNFKTKGLSGDDIKAVVTFIKTLK
jgi:mono/diheme cytochrome c family protein